MIFLLDIKSHDPMIATPIPTAAGSDPRAPLSAASPHLHPAPGAHSTVSYSPTHLPLLLAKHLNLQAQLKMGLLSEALLVTFFLKGEWTYTSTILFFFFPLLKI